MTTSTTGSTTPAPEQAPEQPPLLSHRQILAIFAGLMAGMFLAALDQTIVATSVRTIADDLNGLSLQASVTTAYLITSTVTTPLYGKLSDIYGRKPLFLFAISLFMVGSLACMFAQSMYQLAAFRGLQGLGAGGLFSLALTIIGDVVAPRERAKYQGYFVAVFGTSSVIGPLVGGFLAGQDEILGIAGWRWVFGINLPVGVIALLIVMRVLNIPHRKRPHRIDWPGALALVTGVVPLLLVAEQGREWGWTSPASQACYLVGVLGLLLFVFIERRYGDDALLPPRFFRVRVFGLGTLASVIAGMGMFGAIAALPLYLQIVKGASPTQAGLLTLPLMFGIMSMSITSGQIISRTGRLWRWPLLGVALMVVGLLLLSRIGVDTPFWQAALYMVVFGWGLGCTMQPLTLAIQSAMPPSDMGVATASATFFRQLGGTLGTAVFLSLLFGTVGEKISSAFRAAAGTPEFAAALADPAVRANPDDARVIDALSGAGPGSISLDDSSFIQRLDPRLARPFLEGFADSMSLVFVVGAAVLLLGFAALALMPEQRLRQVSGLEAQRSGPPGAPGAVPPVAEPIAVAGTAAVGAAGGAAVGAGAAAAVMASDGAADGQRNGHAARSAERAAGDLVPGSAWSDDAWSDDGARSAEHPDLSGLAGPEPVAGSAEPAADDVLRERLVAQLVPDLDATLAVLRTAARARDDVRRSRRELNLHTATLQAARRELSSRGLDDRQIDRLLDLSPAEVDRAASARITSTPN